MSPLTTTETRASAVQVLTTKTDSIFGRAIHPPQAEAIIDLLHRQGLLLVTPADTAPDPNEGLAQRQAARMLRDQFEAHCDNIGEYPDEPEDCALITDACLTLGVDPLAWAVLAKTKATEQQPQPAQEPAQAQTPEQPPHNPEDDGDGA